MKVLFETSFYSRISFQNAAFNKYDESNGGYMTYIVEQVQ